MVRLTLLDEDLDILKNKIWQNKVSVCQPYLQWKLFNVSNIQHLLYTFMVTLYFKVSLLHVTFTYYYNNNKVYIIICK